MAIPNSERVSWGYRRKPDLEEKDSESQRNYSNMRRGLLTRASMETINDIIHGIFLMMSNSSNLTEAQKEQCYEAMLGGSRYVCKKA